MASAGPLDGITVLELAAIGPAPFGVMLLADLGAEVIRVDRVANVRTGTGPELGMRGVSRNRRSVGIDVRTPEGRDLVLALAERCDVLVEGFRPGVVERLGIGPDDCAARNPGLVYARMTGWGQDGPLAPTAGHDLDYAAIAGAIHAIGRKDSPPPPPLNLVADFAGGGCYLAIGVLAALVERARSGRGQVVDAAMVDGVVSLTAFFHGLMELGSWTTERQANLLDGGTPWYDTYATSDGGYMAIGPVEPQFYAQLLDGMGLDPAEWLQHDQSRWPALRARLTELFGARTRDEWVAVFDGTDACVAPVLTMAEAPSHPHLVARQAFVDVGGSTQPAPAPRFSRTPGTIRRPAPAFGQDSDALLAELGLDEAAIAALRTADVVA